MTLEEIRIKLELKPFDEFECNMLATLYQREQKIYSSDYAIKERYRQTGRSTKIICRLLSDLSYGHQVAFISHNFHSTRRWLEMINKYAAILKLDLNLIVNINASFNYQDSLMGIDSNKIHIFYDHEAIQWHKH